MNAYSKSAVADQGQTSTNRPFDRRRDQTRVFFPALCNRLFLGMTMIMLVGAATFRSNAAVIYYANANQTNNVPDGVSWSTAFPQVQPAINAASDGDAVWVAAGTYLENLKLSDGVALYGGFNGDETSLSQRSWTSHATVLDGRQSNSVITLAIGATVSTRVDGFYLRNGSARYGAGICCSNASATIANNHLFQNQGYGGGAIACINSSSVIVSNLIQNNSTSFTGGGLYLISSSVTIKNNRVLGNYAYWGGGGIYYSDQDSSGTQSSEIAGNLILGNFGPFFIGGGGLLAGGYGSLLVANNTIVWNRLGTVVPTHGGGVYCPMAGAALANNIIAFNDSGIFGVAGLLFKNNCVFGNKAGDFYNFPDQTGTNGNISIDPQLFASPSCPLLPSSPCIDAGNNGFVNSTADLYGNPRIVGGTVDIGAMEYSGAPPVLYPDIVRVSPVGNDYHDGSSWDNAKRTLQGAIDQASFNRKEIWVSAGNYFENSILRHFVSLYGGFGGSETSREQRDWKANVTLVDGGFNGSVITATNLLQWITIDGFVIQNGRTDSGGGIYCNSTTPVIANNTIRGNVATNQYSRSGGGIYCASDSSTPVITNNLIAGNIAAAGGGIWCSSYEPALIANNRFCGNRSDVAGPFTPNGIGGGGIYVARSTPAMIQNNFFLNNLATNSSGSSLPFGGAIFVSTVGSTPPQIAGNTLLGNRASDGGGIYFDTTTFPKLWNNLIAFGNSGVKAGNPGDTRYNCVFGNTTNFTGGTDLTGTNGNISVDPLLVADDDYHLSANSPLINAGANAYVPSSTDLDGHPRIVGGTVDIGASEFQTPASLISYAWLQQYALTNDSSADFVDTDGDGLNNWQEWRAGTDPTNAVSVLKMVAVSNTVPSVTVTWQSVGGVNYFLQRSSDLTAQTAFSTLATSIPGQTGTTSYTDTNAAGSGPIFYRVGVQ